MTDTAAVNDDNGHGTNMAGIIARVHPQARLLPLKALDAEGVGTISAVVAAMERGYLADEFRAVRVWTLGPEEKAAQEEWLVARREADGRVSYGLSKAGAATSLGALAGMKCERHFIECSNQEAKSELGWDELRAQ